MGNWGIEEVEKEPGFQSLSSPLEGEPKSFFTILVGGHASILSV